MAISRGPCTDTGFVLCAKACDKLKYYFISIFARDSIWSRFDLVFINFYMQQWFVYLIVFISYAPRSIQSSFVFMVAKPTIKTSRMYACTYQPQYVTSSETRREKSSSLHLCSHLEMVIGELKSKCYC